MTIHSFFQRHYRRSRGRLDLDWVTPDLAVGCLPKPHEVPALREAGITGTLCLVEQAPPYFEAAARAGIAVRHVPLVDWAPPTAEQLDAAVAALEELRATGGKQLVHSRAGIGRAVVVTIAFLERRGLAINAATALVRGSRRAAAPNTRQIRALEEYCQRVGSRQ